MSIRLFAIPGYVHLFRSLLRFSRLSVGDAAGLVHMLNTANLDSYRDAYPGIPVYENGPLHFSKCLFGAGRPYRTEVQLYKSLEALKRNINYDALTSMQREAVQQMQCVAANLKFDFYKVFGLEIDSPLTVYRQCRNHLIPHEDEPSVCLFKDWVSLPMA